nr:hypothetical protein [Fredinandcohnia onubensis]
MAARKCWKCNRVFHVPEDELSEHSCPNGCYDHQEDDVPGVDFYGDEIGEGDEYIVDHDTGEFVHKLNLEKYLEEEKGFKFSIAG